MAAPNKAAGAPEETEALSQQPEQLGRGTVAKGRSIDDGKAKYGPGTEVEMPVTEIQRLRKLGYLITPGAPQPSFGDGPTFIKAGL
ncbi:hypothetical protein D3869_01430 [Azospirillum brasilense]|uniref:Uncharacterized protein n=1 Tax=Azospirillum brasilense TaxID=192 RepID=A0A4D8QTF0_AZOBR|nr:hypothetical protein [Azospirillum brasilense]QCO13998.1 hypothetical protein D3869_01430 [Azospirillum brasilense]